VSSQLTGSASSCEHIRDTMCVKHTKQNSTTISLNNN